MRGYPQWRWHLDEVFVKVNGTLCYPWRAVDHEGEVLEAVVTARRAPTSDARKGPRPASTVMSATEEALIVVFRKHTRLTLDVCLAHLKPRIPTLTRSALHRGFKRYRVSRIPKGLAEIPPKFGLRIGQHGICAVLVETRLSADWPISSLAQIAGCSWAGSRTITLR